MGIRFVPPPFERGISEYRNTTKKGRGQGDGIPVPASFGHASTSCKAILPPSQAAFTRHGFRGLESLTRIGWRQLLATEHPRPIQPSGYQGIRFLWGVKRQFSTPNPLVLKDL